MARGENRGRFQKGRTKTGGRQPGGSKAQIALKEAILQAFDKVGGPKYLEAIALSNPQVFASLLGRVLPLTLAGDPDQPQRLIVEWQEPGESE